MHQPKHELNARPLQAGLSPVKPRHLQASMLDSQSHELHNAMELKKSYLLICSSVPRLQDCVASLLRSGGLESG